MNEVKEIHLGRQPFTISVDAHKALQEYLHAIEEQAGKGSDVVKEVELRMAELLHERGITGEKVVLAEDVTFLKEQLGTPADFKDDEHTPKHEPAGGNGPKRLYRDTEHGMIAGVSSGLAAYFNVDPILFRLLFVVLVFSGGAGVLLYALLWLLVPEATTPSEKLQMRGKAVTIENIKESVSRAAKAADLPGVTKRAGGAANQLFGFIGELVRYAIVVVLTTISMIMFVWTIIAGVYTLMHGLTLGDRVIFPIGAEAVWGVVSVMVTLAVLALLLMAVAMATLKRKWTMPGWVTGTMIGVIFIAASVGTAIGFEVAPQVRDRYRELQQTQTYDLPPFNKTDLIGKEATFRFEPDDEYKLEVRYFGQKDQLQGIDKKVENGTLKIDTTGYKGEERDCVLCIDPGDELEVIIHAPATHPLLTP